MLPTGPGEGVPRVLLEAMAAGLPIVTTNVAGIPSLITHDHNGLLVDTDSCSALRCRPAAHWRRRAAAASDRQRLQHGARIHPPGPGGAHGPRRRGTLRPAVETFAGVRPHDDHDGRGSRVCFVLPSLNGGGAERAAVQILNALDSSRWNRSMYLFERKGPYLVDVDPAIALTCARRIAIAPMAGSVHLFSPHPSAPDGVVSQLFFGAGRRARRADRRPVVFNQQTPMSSFLTDQDYRWRRRWDRRRSRSSPAPATIWRTPS